ncbi:MAG: hypothetical protein MI863_26420 [Desulfobacterales bacterium]|nr:hypothetical protein [Desulfobacterales bacterium]
MPEPPGPDINVDNRLKLTILMPVWSPMRHTLFQMLASRPDIRLRLLFEKEALGHRPSWQADSGAAYDWEIIHSFHPGFVRRFRLIPYRLPFFIQKDPPDVLIVVCLAQAVIALLSVCFMKTKIILWTGENRHVLSRRSSPGLMKLIRRIIYPFIDGFGCYSDATGLFLKNEFGVPESKLFKIPQSIDNRHFKRDEKKMPHGREEEKYTFLIVSRLTPLKGLVRMITAWQKLPREMSE